MNAEQAAGIVESNRAELGLDPEFLLEDARRAIVEYKRDREKPGPTKNRIAWVLRYVSPGGYADVQVDDETSKVLHVRRTA